VFGGISYLSHCCFDFLQLLERALRSHPASEGADRWGNIAKAVGTRTKEECVARFKACDSHVTMILCNVCLYSAGVGGESESKETVLLNSTVAHTLLLVAC
jgi:hypothetical protein